MITSSSVIDMYVCAPHVNKKEYWSRESLGIFSVLSSLENYTGDESSIQLEMAKIDDALLPPFDSLFDRPEVEELVQKIWFETYLVAMNITETQGRG